MCETLNQLGFNVQKNYKEGFNFYLIPPNTSHSNCFRKSTLLLTLILAGYLTIDFFAGKYKTQLFDNHQGVWLPSSPGIGMHVEVRTLQPYQPHSQSLVPTSLIPRFSSLVPSSLIPRFHSPVFIFHCANYSASLSLFWTSETEVLTLLRDLFLPLPLPPSLPPSLSPLDQEPLWQVNALAALRCRGAVHFHHPRLRRAHHLHRHQHHPLVRRKQAGERACETVSARG